MMYKEKKRKISGLKSLRVKLLQMKEHVDNVICSKKTCYYIKAVLRIVKIQLFKYMLYS